MSLVAWVGHCTTSTVKVGILASATGAVRVIGYTDYMAITANGVAVLEITGLSSDYRQTVTVAHNNGETATIEISTDPQAGERFTLAWCSCHYEYLDFWPGYIIEQLKPRRLVHLGDNMYQGGATLWGETTLYVPNYALDANNHAAKWRQMIKIPGMIRAGATTPRLLMLDDHDDLPGDDFSHSLATANDGTVWATTQADVDTCWALCQAEAIKYMATNPSSMTTAWTDKPYHADADAANYTPKYFRFVVGDVEFFVLDCVTYKSDPADTNDSNKWMIGPTQKAALIDFADNSTARFKFVLSPKKLFNFTTDNGDTFGVYTTERESFLPDIIGKIHGWLSADKHYPHVAYITTAHGYASNLLDVCACPVTANTGNVSNGYSSVDGKTNIFIWKAGGYPNTGVQKNCFGWLERSSDDQGDYVELSIRSMDSEGYPPLWRGRVYAGSPDLVYPSRTLMVD